MKVKQSFVVPFYSQTEDWPEETWGLKLGQTVDPNRRLAGGDFGAEARTNGGPNTVMECLRRWQSGAEAVVIETTRASFGHCYRATRLESAKQHRAISGGGLALALHQPRRNERAQQVEISTSRERRKKKMASIWRWGRWGRRAGGGGGEGGGGGGGERRRWW
jgi:hypothetical protein